VGLAAVLLAMVLYMRVPAAQSVTAYADAPEPDA
jgi:hypothetical protein